MSQKRVSQTILATVMVLMSAEGAWARTATAPRPTAEATRPAAIGAAPVAASMSIGAAQTAVNAATKSAVVSANTKQRLIDGLTSSKLEEVKAAQELLAGLSSSDTSRKSQILAALASGSIVSAAASVDKQSAGQELIARAQQAGQPSKSGGTCSNLPAVPSAASSVIAGVKDCGLSLSAVQVAYEVATEVAADGNPSNDASQFADLLDQRNDGIKGRAEGIAAVKTVFTKCINGTPGFQKQVQAL